ncbi:hypothetical protein OUZ56_033099 [Daphnia magna]|uniref:Uncharacterized protein n=1 Tax=Daphnia magna TaxID=35525 RepID=A0ABR0BA59_9CRUS|nr:hypothetical protein OUZ56_033099 [Daphnia magna]
MAGEPEGVIPFHGGPADGRLVAELGALVGKGAEDGVPRAIDERIVGMGAPLGGGGDRDGGNKRELGDVGVFVVLGTKERRHGATGCREGGKVCEGGRRFDADDRAWVGKGADDGVDLGVQHRRRRLADEVGHEFTEGRDAGRLFFRGEVAEGSGAGARERRRDEHASCLPGDEGARAAFVNRKRLPAFAWRKDRRRPHQRRAPEKDGEPGDAEEQRRAEEAGDRLIEGAAERNAIARAEADEGEPRLPDDRRRGARPELNGDRRQHSRQVMHARRPQQAAAEGERRLDEGGPTKHPRLHRGEARKRRPRGHRKHACKMHPTRRAHRREQDHRQQKAWKCLQKIAGTQEHALDAAAPERCADADEGADGKAKQGDDDCEPEAAKKADAEERGEVDAGLRAAKRMAQAWRGEGVFGDEKNRRFVPRRSSNLSGAGIEEPLEERGERLHGDEEEPACDDGRLEDRQIAPRVGFEEERAETAPLKELFKDDGAAEEGAKLGRDDGQDRGGNRRQCMEKLGTEDACPLRAGDADKEGVGRCTEGGAGGPCKMHGEREREERPREEEPPNAGVGIAGERNHWKSHSKEPGNRRRDGEERDRGSPVEEARKAGPRRGGQPGAAREEPEGDAHDQRDAGRKERERGRCRKRFPDAREGARPRAAQGRPEIEGCKASKILKIL